jgi:WD40 repeat protein
MRLWDVETGVEIRNFKHGGWLTECKVLSVAFSPDRRLAASGGNDKTIRLWDLQTGKEVRRLTGHEHTVPSVAFSSDGRRLLSAGSEDKTVRFWDVETGNELRRLVGHTGMVICVAISPDGRRALSGAGALHRSGWFSKARLDVIDSTLRLWDLETGQELHCFAVHQSPVASVAFTGDGQRALSSSGHCWIKPMLLGTEPIDCTVRLLGLPP